MECSSALPADRHLAVQCCRLVSEDAERRLLHHIRTGGGIKMFRDEKMQFLKTTKHCFAKIFENYLLLALIAEFVQHSVNCGCLGKVKSDFLQDYCFHSSGRIDGGHSRKLHRK